MNIKNVNFYNVSLKMPQSLNFLDTLKDNIWWCWQHNAVELLSSIDSALWEKSGNNLMLFLNNLSQEKLEELSKDERFLAKLEDIEKSFDTDVASKNINTPEDIKSRKLAYFSLEYGIHESLRLYSGGLGVLSGDHLKAASDLSLPMVAVGLLYKKGYFVQKIDKNGWQNENYPENELQNMPISPAKDVNGNDVRVTLNLADSKITVAAWVLNVGNIPLILLDTNLQENPENLRDITSTLYGGDKTMRIHQELVLAVAGYKAIRAMGYPAESCHLNEGHAAFLSFARIGDLVDRGVELNAAVEIVWSSNIFTTHTPVPAGNEVFDIALIRPYLEALQKDFKLDVDRMISWGVAPEQKSDELSMTILGLRMSYYSNGVSRLHGEVAREMWAYLWDELPPEELPVTSITNGVHIDSWLSATNSTLLKENLSNSWFDTKDTKELASEINKINDDKIWAARESGRAQLIKHARKRLTKQLVQSNASNSQINLVKKILDPHTLTIGFARRFATYKRATLLLRDKERLLTILKNEERPVQIIFAGKAHPADDGGKRLIQDIIRFAKENGVENKLVFIDDYDIELGRYLTQGVDVWLNNPLRPQEASGTSGMKAAANGALNCSILDGWWEEGYEIDPNSGWAILNENASLSQEDIDNFESNALYTLLEEEILPTFYNRPDGEIPTMWVKMIKASMSMSLYNFSSRRMVSEYNERFYMPAIANYARLSENNQSVAKNMVVQKHAYAKYKENIYIAQPTVECNTEKLHVDDEFDVETEVYLVDLKPEEVKVEAYFGQVDLNHKIVNGESKEFKLVSKLDNGNYKYACKIKCDTTGRFGITSRVTSVAEEWAHRIPTFIKWAD